MRPGLCVTIRFFFACLGDPVVQFFNLLLVKLVLKVIYYFLQLSLVSFVQMFQTILRLIVKIENLNGK